jgi:hypothetical protein
MSKITRENAEKLIRSSNGSIFSVTFRKTDGTLRDMVCRTGVRKGVNGKGLAFDPSEYDLKTVFDVQANAFRMIRLETLERIAIDGKEYTVIQ